MANFMPVDPQKAQELNDKLSKTIFRSTKDFVSFYNSGLINKKNKDVMALASEMVATFRDVKEKNSTLYFISQEEVYLDEVKEELDKWTIIVQLKGRLTDLLADETISRDEIIVFSAEEVGYALRLNEEGETVRVGEKMFSKQSDISSIYEKLSTQRNDELAEQGTYKFMVRDLTDVDDSFISDIREMLPR